MVCIYCQGQTKVSNSRLNKLSNQVWRRRQCQDCLGTYTSLENADLSRSWRVRDATGFLDNFLADKLYLSLYDSLKHRKTAIVDSRQLANTVVNKLGPKAVNGLIESQIIKEIVLVSLNRFDKAASSHYKAFHDH